MRFSYPMMELPTTGFVLRSRSLDSLYKNNDSIEKSMVKLGALM